MTRVAIIGGGQAGLQLALGLLANGVEITLVSNRTAEEIATGQALSSQCMFESALQTERVLGLDYWATECPPVEGIALTVAAADGGKALEWSARLDWPAQSVDQRLKIPTWLDELVRRGGELEICEAGLGDLERYAAAHDLVVVATGRAEAGGLFPLDVAKSPFSGPQRVLALTYVTGMEPRPGYSAVCFNLIPGVGEYFVFPALTARGTCEIMVFEGVPGGPMDCWDDVTTPEEHLARSLEILERFLPWEASRCRDVELTDPNGILTGSLTPAVRDPVGRLPSGAVVLGMADAVVLNDPVTGQGSNNAAKCADIYLAAILEQGSGFDERFMRRTFDRYWRGYAESVVAWTNSLLTPPEPHVQRLLAAAADVPALAGTIANGFDDPQVFSPWWYDAAEADRLIAERRGQQREPFDQRELRRALGQFATGVAVVTTRGEDGLPVGVTANSFTSLSLDPPLVLWCLGKESTNLAAFEAAPHFAVNVLSSTQHYLSRQFAIQGGDKFAGVELSAGLHDLPLLGGALARFACRTTERLDGGDHIIVIGEIEHFEIFDGEPLVFHSGSYRVATRHPDFDA